MGLETKGNKRRRMAESIIFLQNQENQFFQKVTMILPEGLGGWKVLYSLRTDGWTASVTALCRPLAAALPLTRAHIHKKKHTTLVRESYFFSYSFHSRFFSQSTSQKIGKYFKRTKCLKCNNCVFSAFKTVSSLFSSCQGSHLRRPRCRRALWPLQ